MEREKTAWQTWNVFEEISPIFSKLSSYPVVLDDADICELEKFVMALYDKSSSADTVDKARLDLFARKQRNYDAIPPSSAALCEHIKRAVYQAGMIWGQAMVPAYTPETPSDWGWTKINNEWVIYWTSLPPIAESCQELVKCACKKRCSGQCSCFRMGLPCTALCTCSCEG